MADVPQLSYVSPAIWGIEQTVRFQDAATHNPFAVNDVWFAREMGVDATGLSNASNG
jgi:hypothetical protein